MCIYQTAIIICTNAWVKEWEWDKQLFKRVKSADPDSGEYDDLIKEIKDLPVVHTAWAD